MVELAPQKPQELIDEEENIINSTGQELVKNISYYKTQLYTWTSRFDGYARKSIRDASIDWNQEVIRLLGSNSIFQAMRVFIGSNQSQDNHSKEGVLGKITNFSSQINNHSSFQKCQKLRVLNYFKRISS